MRIFLLILLFLFSFISTEAQRRKSKNQDVWPPERSYGRTTLGGALQDIFARHYEFCGFPKAAGRRDYTPPTMERFIGNRSLRTRVESADLNGGNLLNYVFSAQEAAAPLNAIRFDPNKLLFTPGSPVNLNPEPRPGFDAFLLTKNCSGYLKAHLDGGLKPPYASFTAALDTDANKKSTVVAVAGSFVSPITEILRANDARTTELMALLWYFYQDHPEYAGSASYLAQFEGVMIKHLTDAGTIRRHEQSLGVNVSVPLAGQLKSGVTRGGEREESFSGTDWETIVYTDFIGPYQRENLFLPLPTPWQIQAYFANQPLLNRTAVLPALREGASHKHSFTISGLPGGLAGAAWQLGALRGNAFSGPPHLEVRPAGDRTLQFTVSGQASDELFLLDHPGAIAEVPVYYELVLPARAGIPPLTIPVRQRIATSTHPLLDVVGSPLELKRKNNGEFALRWIVGVEVTDRENPLDPNGTFQLSEVSTGENEVPLAIRPVRIDYTERRGILTVVLETERTWPLAQIDEQNLRRMPVRGELTLPVLEGTGKVRRRLEAYVSVPKIRLEPVPVLPESSVPKGVEGGRR